MASSGFTKMSEFSEVQEFTDVESGGKQPQNMELATLNTENTTEEQEVITPLSLNPMDWMRDMYKEYKEWKWAMTEKKRVLLRAVFGEGLCTFIFLFVVMAAGVNNGRQENPESLVLGAIVTAFCAVALIYSFADVSGAHFNPAVTFATMVTGKVSFKKGASFILIQMFAGILATAYLAAVFPKEPEANKGHVTNMANKMTVQMDPKASVARAFFMEATLTFILIYVIFATAFDTVDTKASIKVGDKNTNAGKALTIYTTSGSSKAGFAPIAIGFTLGFLGLLGGSVSGGAFNPARAFGPAVLSGNWDNHWIYWFGDFLGAGLAGWAQSMFAHKPAVERGGHLLSNKHDKAPRK